jgi:LysM repeat protein
VVKRGDTLSGLSVRYGTSVSELRRLNSMSSRSMLQKGRKLKLPVASAAPPPVSRPSYHVVKRGDTLSALAVRYGMSVAEVRRLNGIKNGAVLRVGKKLKLM